MKTIFFVWMTTFALSTAYADGFRCQGVNTGHNIKVYNFTYAGSGTRNPAIMVVSDSFVTDAYHTLAKFTYEKESLRYLGYGQFEGSVDSKAGKIDQIVAGTTLGELKTIQLQLFARNGEKFTYDVADTFKNQDVLDARFSYVKHSGEVLEEKAICSRFVRQ